MKVVGAIVAVIVLFGGGVLLGATVLSDGSDDPPVEPIGTPTPSPSPTPTPAASPSPSPLPEPTATIVPIAECSASKLDNEVDAQRKLPIDVDRLRLRIWAAARACDFDLLDTMAREGDGRFSYSFGATELPKKGDFAVHLRSVDPGDKAMRVLAQILELPYCVQNSGGEGSTVYQWPAIACKESPTDADWEQLEGVYSPRLIRQSKQLGHYLLYRAGITQDGDWMFYIAGD